MSDIHALVGAYAVDALDDIERQQFERHLATCADCRDEVASLRDASSMLSGITLSPPPPSLRDRVMADISTVRPLPPEVPVRKEAPRRRRFPALVAAAAAVAVMGGGAVAITQPWHDDSSQQLTAAGRVLAASDAKTVGVELDGGTKAELVRSESKGQAVLVTHDMPAAPAGKVYQVWLQSDEGEMIPAGLMSGGSDAEVLLDGDAASATAAGITVEPAGGSTSPTSDPIVLFDFAQAT
ncbi:MAG TPA: anti-sigma factor [Nocardioides sp.]